MLNDPSDDRSKLARAVELGSLGTSIAMEMVVPVLIGYFIDRRLGMTPWFTILGGVFGLSGGLWHLIRLTRGMGEKADSDRKRGDSNRRLPPCE